MSYSAGLLSGGSRIWRGGVRYFLLLPHPSSLSLPPIPFSPWGPPFFQLVGLGSALSFPNGLRGKAPAAKAILTYLEPRNVPGDKHLDHSCVIQNAYGSPYIMRSSAPVTDREFDLQKL